MEGKERGQQMAETLCGSWKTRGGADDENEATKISENAPKQEENNKKRERHRALHDERKGGGATQRLKAGEAVIENITARCLGTSSLAGHTHTRTDATSGPINFTHARAHGGLYSSNR